MSMTERTQVLLTPAQRAKAERIAQAEGISIGAVLRAALDAYGHDDPADRERAVEELVSMNAPVDEWHVLKSALLETRFERSS